jgi:putative ABC transport system ATP-binding protein
MVTVRDVVKAYQLDGLAVPALRGVSFQVEEGSFMAIMGPSGCGKSTLLNLLSCLDRPTSGTVEIGGVDTSKMSSRELAALRNKKIGFVFQTFHLLSRATAVANVMLPFLYSDFPRAQRRPRALELLSYVGLQDRIGHRPTQLSGGQQQRVAIARALANDPQLILADEPTGNLDSVTGEEIMASFERIWQQGNTVILVTHEADIAAHAHRTVRMRDGKIESDVRRAATAPSAVAAR